MAVFTWRAEVGSTGNGEFSVFSTKFGDGYSQDIPNGLNNETQKWSVKVSGYEKNVQPVIDFIRSHKGQPFQWKPPSSVGLGWYSCKRYSLNPGGGAWTEFNMEFEQSYAP
jgi:phage-related protein